jgi:protein-disulfide isomerase
MTSRYAFVLALVCVAALPAAAAAQASPTLAVIDGRPITEAEAEEATGDLLHRARTGLYEARRAAAEAVIARTLLEKEAKRRNIAFEQLDGEIIASSLHVSDEEARRVYEANRARIGQPFDEIKPQLVNMIRQQRMNTARARVVEELKKSSSVKIVIAPPTIDVAPIGPSRGGANARVTIVEFSDFECTFCQRSQATLKQLLEKYGDAVRLVYRDFPGEAHPAARPAAEAARCANEQGKFWEYHDTLFANQTALGGDDLKRYAKEVGLDEEAFTACLRSGRHREALERDIRDGQKGFVEGTPTFFVNGRPLAGAQPYEVFVKVIEEELERLR